MYRKFGDFYSDFLNDLDRRSHRFPRRTSTTWTSSYNSNTYERKYYGLNVSASYRVFDSFNLGGNWTWSHTYGNIIGETSGSGPVTGEERQLSRVPNLNWNSPDGGLLAGPAPPDPPLRQLRHPAPEGPRRPQPERRPSLRHRHSLRGGRQRRDSQVRHEAAPGYETPPPRRTTTSPRATPSGPPRQPPRPGPQLLLTSSARVEIFVQPQVLKRPQRPGRDLGQHGS